MATPPNSHLHDPPFTPPGSSRVPTPSSSRLDLRANLSAIFNHNPSTYGASFTTATATAAAAAAAPSGSSNMGERTRLLVPSGEPRKLWTDNVARSIGSGVGSDSPGVSGLSRSLDDLHDDDLAIGPRRKTTTKSKTAKVAKKIRQRSRYYVPVTDWLPQYSWSLFSGDLVAGVSVACLLIPQGISYASGLAKLNPVAGLWSTAVPALVYGALGTCRQLSIGPEAALSLLIGQMIDELVYGDPHTVPMNPELEAIAIAVITTFQVGLITSVLGLLRLGFLDVVLSRALLRGFITAVGIIIFIEQSIPMLGMAALLAHADDPPSLPIWKLVFTLKHIKHANIPTTIMSFSCLAFLIAAKVIKQSIIPRPGGAWLRFVPEILIVVVSTTVVTSVFHLDLEGVAVLGKISGGKDLPFGVPLFARSLKYFNYTFPTAFVMAVVGVVDSMVAARENAAKFGYPVSPNRELVALGASNLAASCITATGCVPVFGSLTRSRLNAQTGSRTQMASIITAFIMIMSIFFLLPFLYFLPKAVLAAIITLVVYAILAEAPHDIIFFWKMRAWTDFLQMTGTFILTLFFSIEVGLVASVGFSLILVIQKSTQTRIKIIGRLPHTDEWVPIDEDESAQEEIPGVLVVRIRESLSFANTGQLKERLRRLELYGMQKSHPSDAPRRESAKAVILHMGDVEDIDASAIQILGELTKSYYERGVGIHFAHLRASQLDSFALVGITDLLGPTHFHSDLRDAMREVESMGYGNSAVSRFD